MLGRVVSEAAMPDSSQPGTFSLDYSRHVVRDGALESQVLARGGVNETQFRRVQQNARSGQQALEASRVDPLAEKRMAPLREMNADLVRASGLQPAFDQGRSFEPFEHANVGHRLASEIVALRRAATPVA